ncbi:hypothetical protein OH76DRAFT_1491192 [Lentinus brumalis]|uniref:Uncharacterized protein n=1 Tax=Lentinus brumalis TaxID=2498619 RepID=A0A371CGK7_9APHY|nr:hypothetical protein OH76DRAFT_1491192 [Polyporus brumalis]
MPACPSGLFNSLSSPCKPPARARSSLARVLPRPPHSSQVTKLLEARPLRSYKAPKLLEAHNSIFTCQLITQSRRSYPASARQPSKLAVYDPPFIHRALTNHLALARTVRSRSPACPSSAHLLLFVHMSPLYSFLPASDCDLLLRCPVCYSLLSIALSLTLVDNMSSCVLLVPALSYLAACLSSVVSCSARTVSTGSHSIISYVFSARLLRSGSPRSSLSLVSLSARW